MMYIHLFFKMRLPSDLFFGRRTVSFPFTALIASLPSDGYISWYYKLTLSLKRFQIDNVIICYIYIFPCYLSIYLLKNILYFFQQPLLRLFVSASRFNMKTTLPYCLHLADLHPPLLPVLTVFFLFGACNFAFFLDRYKI